MEDHLFGAVKRFSILIHNWYNGMMFHYIFRKVFLAPFTMVPCFAFFRKKPEKVPLSFSHVKKKKFY